MIWLQGWDSLPKKYDANLQSIINKNPDWQVNQWDEPQILDVLKSMGQPYLDKYNSLKLLLQKVDFARYAILHQFGGVSVDADAVALKSFNETPHLNDSDFIVSKNSISSFINNATILVSKSNPLMKELLDSIATDCKSYQGDTLCVLNTTGPIAFTKFINKHRNEITVLDPSYLEPCSGMDKYCQVKPNSILDHRHEGSWVSPTFKGIAKVHYFLIEHKAIVISILLALILLFLAKRVFKQ